MANIKTTAVATATVLALIGFATSAHALTIARVTPISASVTLSTSKEPNGTQSKANEFACREAESKYLAIEADYIRFGYSRGRYNVGSAQVLDETDTAFRAWCEVTGTVIAPSDPTALPPTDPQTYRLYLPIIR